EMKAGLPTGFDPTVWGSNPSINDGYPWLLANPPPGTLIADNGTTSLTEVGNHYFLYADSTRSGPSLKYAGMDVVAGEFGTLAPIGAVQTASGYEVAWKLSGADQYFVWNADSSGNLTSLATAVVSGSDYALESLEPSFHLDLNGDHQIGPPKTVIADN